MQSFKDQSCELISWSLTTWSLISFHQTAAAAAAAATTAYEQQSWNHKGWHDNIHEKHKFLDWSARTRALHSFLPALLSSVSFANKACFLGALISIGHIAPVPSSLWQVQTNNS
jgi:hypothetical protein